MHDTLAVAEVEGLEQLEYVVSDVVVVELRIERAEIRIVDVLEYQGWSLTLIYGACVRITVSVRGGRRRRRLRSLVSLDHCILCGLRPLPTPSRSAIRR